MPYGSVIDRTSDAASLIPEDVSREIIQGVVNQSAALALFRHRRMTRAQQRMPVLSLLPTAYWVTGDTGLKQTSELNWANKYLDAAELAVIVPIPENVLADVDYDIWDEARPWIEEAIAVALDDAVFFGINKPTEWSNVTSLVPAAIAASNNVQVGSQTPNDVAAELNAIMAAVEADGFTPNGFWAKMSFKSRLRNARSTTNELLFMQSGPANTGIANNKVDGMIMGEKAVFNNAGLTWTNAAGGVAVQAITGDWNQGIIGIRDDISFKKLDQAVLQDAGGNIIYNLAQQDMVALRVTARFAFQVPNPITRANTNATTRYPFAILYV